MYDSDLFEMYTDAEHGLQTNRIPLRIYRRKHSIQSPVPLHSHNFWEIALVLSGTGRHVVYLPEREEIVYPISDGDVCMIAPGKSTRSNSSREKNWKSSTYCSILWWYSGR